MKYFRFFVVLFFIQRALWGEQFTITSLDDSGTGTLRDALNRVQEGDVITFDPLLSGTITLLSLLPPIDAGVKILGTPSGGITISGNYQFPIFQINSEKVQVSDLQIEKAGSGGSGAGLFIADGASVSFFRGSINDCLVLGNQGGAIHVGNNAKLEIEDTIFSGNTSEGPGDDIFLGTDSLVTYTSTKNIPSIKIFGKGHLIKLGEGSATFTIPSTAAIDLIALRGTTISTGMRTTSTFVLYGAKLEGTQTCLDILNNGTVKPSETIGTSIITKDYRQAPTATLEIAITPDANDLLKIDGDAYLHGTLFVDPKDGRYSIGTTYTIITGGSVSGKFDAVKSSNMTFEVHYLSQSVVIEITAL